MGVNQKKTGRASSIPAGLAVGGVVSLLTTLGSTVLLAWLISGGMMAEKNVGYGVLVMILLASFLGSEVAAGRIKHQRVAVCLLSGLVYFGILLSITALFFGGQYQAVGVTALLILGGSGTATLIGLQRNNGRKRRRTYLHNR